MKGIYVSFLFEGEKRVETETVETDRGTIAKISVESRYSLADRLF